MIKKIVSDFHIKMFKYFKLLEGGSFANQNNDIHINFNFCDTDVNIMIYS